MYFLGLFMFLAICIWAGKQYMQSGEKLNWCYVFACTSVLTSFGCGAMFTVELRAPLQLGEDQENLLMKAAEPEIKPLRPGVSQAELLDITTTKSGLNQSMKSGINTSLYPLT